ncbi:MAG: M1 family aminopeptidase/hydrolase [Acidobacteriota bacterium]|nr:M1 family aminopeptidase/hydrolase [Acidobacteriota bacterium]
MSRRRASLLFATFLFFVAAKHRAVQHPAAWPLGEIPHDQFTASDITKVTTRHVDLDLTVDFEKKQLRGTAVLDIENLTGTNTLVLDTFDMTVTSVMLDGNKTATWKFGTQTQYTKPLLIDIEPSTDTVTIAYSTGGAAYGLQWNTAEQSFGRQQPYLYSLNEPVEARTWIPIQDTPSMRVTYDATLHVPRGLLALMSASNNPTAVNDTGVYRFHMGYPIPPYLIALAVARLEFRAFDERTGVYAEPELMDDAAWELQYLPAMVDAAERVAGRFPFDRHDVLLMPPTFVVGGMEHPMLNFVAPFSLISQNHPANPEPSSLIAHELAHSWAGDATTLATWNDVWLNEGITSYLTLRILEEMMGRERAELSFYIDRVNYTAYANNAKDPRSLTLHIQQVDPNVGFGSTGYTKGELFIKTLEDLIGRETFDFFLKRYFQVHAFRWVDDESFLAALHTFALAGNPDLEDHLQLDAWLYGTSIPSNITAPTSSAILDRATQRANAFASGTKIAQLNPASWSQLDRDQFLAVVNKTQLRSRMAEVDAAFGLASRQSAPLVWLTQSIIAHYEPGMVLVERALMRGGPSSWMVSLYTTMNDNGMHDKAVEIFGRARKRYSLSLELQLKQLLGVASAQTASMRKAA